MDIMYECICVCIAGDPAKNSKLVLLTKDGLSVEIGDVCLEQDVLHGRSIPREYIKIQIDYIKPGTRPLFATRFDDDKLSTDQFTLWPRHLTKSSF